MIWQTVAPSARSIPAAATALHGVPNPKSFWDIAMPFFRIAKGRLQDTWNGLPFTEKLSLGIVALCPIKENWGMMEGRKPKGCKFCSKNTCQIKRDSKSIWLQLQTSQTINLSVFPFHTKKIQEQTSAEPTSKTSLLPNNLPHYV